MNFLRRLGSLIVYPIMWILWFVSILIGGTLYWLITGESLDDFDTIYLTPVMMAVYKKYWGIK